MSQPLFLHKHHPWLLLVYFIIQRGCKLWRALNDSSVCWKRLLFKTAIEPWSWVPTSAYSGPSCVRYAINCIVPGVYIPDRLSQTISLNQKLSPTILTYVISSLHRFSQTIYLQTHSFSSKAHIPEHKIRNHIFLFSRVPKLDLLNFSFQQLTYTTTVPNPNM